MVLKQKIDALKRMRYDIRRNAATRKLVICRINRSFNKISALRFYCSVVVITTNIFLMDCQKFFCNVVDGIVGFVSSIGCVLTTITTAGLIALATLAVIVVPIIQLRIQQKSITSRVEHLNSDIADSHKTNSKKKL